MLVTRAVSITCRQVSSLGPLAAAFNSKQSVQFKFQWGQEKTGLFGLPELKDSRGFLELKERCVRNAEILVEEVISPNRTRNVAVIFDDLSDELCRVADLAEFIRLAHPDPEFAMAAQDACIAISGLVFPLKIMALPQVSLSSKATIKILVTVISILNS